MKITISAFKADIGSIGGHIKPSQQVLDEVRNFIATNGKDLHDYFIMHNGDDIGILMTHSLGIDKDTIHMLAWNAFKAGTEVAKKQGLYGAGQDLLVEAPSGNIRGAGPGVAELEIDERGGEAFHIYMADKTDPGAFSLPLYKTFIDPMNTPGFLLKKSLAKGFRFLIRDMDHKEGDKLIELDSPEEIYNIAMLLRDNQNYAVESITSRHNNEPVVSVSTSRLHNIAGKYVGKDDPVMIVRVQGDFPAAGEVLKPYAIAHYVGGFSHGSHWGPLMPVPINSQVSFFDGPPKVAALGFCVKDGKLTEPADLFDDHFWDHVRSKAATKALGIREQGFSGNAMLPKQEIEYTGGAEILNELDKRFKITPKGKKETESQSNNVLY